MSNNNTGKQETGSRSAIESRDPLRLKLHSARQFEIEPDVNDLNWSGYLNDVRERGIVQPLVIDRNDTVVGDPWPLWAARRWKLESVPVQIVADDQIFTTMVGSLVWRKHYTKSAIAFLAYPLFKKAHQELIERHAEKLRTGNKPTIRHSVPDGQIPSKSEDLAEKMGVSERLFRQAREIHELFSKHPEKRVWEDSEDQLSFREYFLPKLLATPEGGEHQKPLGLGAIIAAIKYLLTDRRNGGKPTAPNRQLELFEKVVDDEINRWEYWQAFDEEVKAGHFAKIRSKASELPPEQCAELAEYHARLAKEFRRAAEQKQEAQSSVTGKH